MPNKKKILIIVITAIVLLLALGSVFYFLFKTKKEVSPVFPKPGEGKTTEEVLKSLTAPENQNPPVSEEVIENLSAPEGKTPTVIPEEVIKDLTAPK